ncbi:hypothetical protein SPAR_37628 [Streptomyces sparsogenes DSM 40356]|uniref:Uncharacterized protein n=1 Tax=Streptomyces sparsogenes DSM 40356 TaxID=1331668 RepID=A0A1R1S7J2_9ACTN|nr:hypothetical protein SPAR_37628 [Streptomyces sparsogenes DSM 40356]
MAVGLALAVGPAAAAPHVGASGSAVMDYYQYHDHYATHEACVAVGEEYLELGADNYECRAKDGGWDLWLIFAT